MTQTFSSQIRTLNTTLPQGWQWVSVGEVVISVSISGKKIPQARFQKSGKYPVVDQGKNLIGGYCDDQSLLVDCQLPIIVFGDHTKAIKFIDFPFVAGADGIKVLKPAPEFDPKLLYYFLQAVKLPEKGYARNYQALKKAVIPLPPLDEQRRIAKRLNEQMAAVESARKAAEEQLQAARQLPSAYLRELFDNDLAHKYPKKTLEDVCSFITDGTHVTPTYVPNGIPFLSVKDVKETGLLFENTRFISEEEHRMFAKRCKPERGDVLYTKVGTTGIAKAVDVDKEFSIFVSVALLKLKHEMITPEYLEKVLNSPICRVQAENLTQGMANRNLVLRDLKRIELPLPPVEKQNQVTKLITETMLSAEAMIHLLEPQLAEINRLPASLLREGFAGGA